MTNLFLVAMFVAGLLGFSVWAVAFLLFAIVASQSPGAQP